MLVIRTQQNIRIPAINVGGMTTSIGPTRSARKLGITRPSVELVFIITRKLDAMFSGTLGFSGGVDLDVKIRHVHAHEAKKRAGAV